MAELKPVDLHIEINGVYQSVDIDKTTSFSFVMQVGELKNPTTTKISSSIKINLPKTDKNNDMFSLMGEYDSRILNINPLVRTPFILYVGDKVFQRGYMKIEGVTLDGYEIRLYEGLGDYFNILRDVSRTRNMRLKSLDFGDMYNHTIDKTELKKYWQTTGKTGEYFDYSTGKKITEEVLNYAMTYQGQYDSFDSGFYVNGILESDVGDIIWESGNKRYSTSRELSEHERSFKIPEITGTQYYGEYRTYYQKPVMKVKPIVCKIIEKMEDEGWTTELDKTFFNKYNPYWNDLWMVCPNLEIDSDQLGETLEINRGTPNFENPSYVRQSEGRVDYRDVTIDNSYYFEEKNYSLNFDIPFWLLTQQLVGNNDRVKKGTPLTITADVYIGGEKQDSRELVYDYNPSARNQIHINDDTVTNKNVTKFRGETGQGQRTNPFYCMRDQQELNKSGYYDSTYRTLYRFRGGVSYTGKGLREKIFVRFTFSGDTNWYKDSKGASIRERSIQMIFNDPANVKGADQTITCSIGTSTGSGTRTGADITYKSIIRTEHTCFDFLMSYLKPFGMYFVKDPVKNKVTIMTRNTYYGNREKVDWTYKIDYSKAHKFVPVPFQCKVGIFKWQDTGSKYEDEYFSKYAKEYGSARFDTGDQFSNKEIEYLDDNIFGNGIVVNGYSSYFLGRNKTLYKDNKELLYFQDSSDTGIDIPYVLCFKEGYKRTEDRFLITDDNDAMLEYGYAYTTDERETLTSYPNISRLTVKGNEPYSLNFGRPATIHNESESDYINDDTTQGSETLYSRFWHGYLSDIFLHETKMLECHVTLTQDDMKDDLFRKFIYINNTVWVLSRIVQFDPTRNRPTKVELISVQDIDAYISQKYIAGNFIINYEGSKVYDYVGEPSTNPVVLRFNSNARTLTFQFVAELDWQIENSPLTVTPVSGTGGGIETPSTTTVTIQVPENTSGQLQTYFIPIKWGNITTFIQVIQQVYRTVTATSNYGTATINGETSPQIIVLNDTATFAVEYDSEYYRFMYWMINGEQYFTESVSLTVLNDLNAEAYLYELPHITIDPQTQAINKAGMSYQINVTSNTTWELTIPEEAADYISADITSGNGDGVVTITVEPNPDPEERTAELTFTTTFGSDDVLAIHTLTQEGAPEIVIAPESASVDFEGN